MVIGATALIAIGAAIATNGGSIALQDKIQVILEGLGIIG